MKRGISGILVTVLLVLFAIIGVVIVWAAIRPALVDSSENVAIGQLTTNLKIVEPVNVDSTNNQVSFKINRRSGAGEIIGVNVILEDLRGNSKAIRIDSVINELETKDVVADFSSSGIAAGDIVRVSIAPIIRTNSNREEIGSIADSVEIDASEVVTPPAPFCGDGNVDSGEVCDDGNTNEHDACTNSCVKSVCGDGLVQGTGSHLPFNNPTVTGTANSNGIDEVCDDGNTIDGDGCSSSCQGESGFVCDFSVEPTECSKSCGNGAIDAGETCDDGDAVGLDGCSSTCQEESGYTCEGTGPGSCRETQCNDGIDNDPSANDGIDFPNDPDCSDINDNSEECSGLGCLGGGF